MKIIAPNTITNNLLFRNINKYLDKPGIDIENLVTIAVKNGYDNHGKVINFYDITNFINWVEHLTNPKLTQFYLDVL